MITEPSLFSALPEEGPRVLTVSELSFEIKNQLERRFPDVWVSGELGKVSDHSSGIYFSLKDDKALIDAVIWRREVRKILQFQLETGMQVVVHGHLDLYLPRGQYKLIVDRVEPKGIGALQKRFEQLKKKLEEEGLFADSRKRPIPFLPKRIGIVTALQGAALWDMLRTILARFPRASVVVCPSRVQGENAASEIARAIADLNEISDVEVLIVGRGGGSLEDLWAFNEEIVARAIVGSRVPVISAVGHEVDFTIADFVADLRAKTPTDAGVLVIPSLADLQSQMGEGHHRLGLSLRGLMHRHNQRIAGLRAHWVFRKPIDRIANLRSELEITLQRMHRDWSRDWSEKKDRSQALGERLSKLRPDARLAKQASRLKELLSRFELSLQKNFARSRERYTKAAERLEGRSPVAILSRGYSLTRLRKDQRLLKDTKGLRVGEEIETRLHRGKIVSKIQEISSDPD